MDKKKRTDGKYLWQSTPNGGVRLLRVYAKDGMVVIPDEIEGCPVTEIGAYCFSDAERLPEHGVKETTYSDQEFDAASFQRIAGPVLEFLDLPDQITEIQDFAFYNCRQLRRLQVGKETKRIGSDIFMNCQSLQTIEVRCGVRESSGVAAMLQQFSSEIVVHFLGNTQGAEVKLLYPEYMESYDEIAPAHIFGRHITGEGFRARQLFDGGVVQMERYDAMLDKLAAEENGQTVGRLSLFRLLYPEALRKEKQEEYERQLRRNAFVTAKYFIDMRELGVLQQMCERRYLQGGNLDEAIQYSVSIDWGEGSASLLDWKQRYGMTDRRMRYLF